MNVTVPRTPAIVTIANKAEAANFRVGTAVTIGFTKGGSVYRLTTWRRFCAAVLRPFRRTFVISSVDPARGIIIIDEAPSWRRFL